VVADIDDRRRRRSTTTTTTVYSVVAPSSDDESSSLIASSVSTCRAAGAGIKVSGALCSRRSVSRVARRLILRASDPISEAVMRPGFVDEAGQSWTTEARSCREPCLIPWIADSVDQDQRVVYTGSRGPQRQKEGSQEAPGSQEAAESQEEAQRHAWFCGLLIP
jgi:hypothetical protein